MFNDLIDSAAAGTTVKGTAEIGEILFRTGGNHFHGAILGVANPAPEGKLACFPMDEPAEADALNAAKNKEMTDHWKDSPLSILGPGEDLGEAGCIVMPGKRGEWKRPVAAQAGTGLGYGSCGCVSERTAQARLR